MILVEKKHHIPKLFFDCYCQNYHLCIHNGNRILQPNYFILQPKKRSLLYFYSSWRERVSAMAPDGKASSYSNSMVQSKVKVHKIMSRTKNWPHPQNRKSQRSPHFKIRLSSQYNKPQTEVNIWCRQDTHNFKQRESLTGELWNSIQGEVTRRQIHRAQKWPPFNITMKQG